MSGRDPHAFLSGTAFAAARRDLLAGDASSRVYWRLGTAGGETAILMDAGKAADNGPFLRVAAHLSGLGLSAPVIHAACDGWILMEDLGDRIFAREMAAGAAAEDALYRLAIDALVALQEHAPPDVLPAYGPAEMGAALRPAAEHVRGRVDADWLAFEAEMTEALARHAHAHATDVFVHRDYHAENLAHLPDRNGVEAVGLLDFQDAVRGHPAYDLTSLLQDARRDLSPGLPERMLAYYCDRAGRGLDGTRRAACLLCAQRNIRILGIFRRLADTRGKPRYLTLMPRVWRHARTALSHPGLAPLERRFAALLPEPQGQPA